MRTNLVALFQALKHVYKLNTVNALRRLPSMLV